jgi:hypothetical protein
MAICPFCAENVPANVRVCPHCSSTLSGDAPSVQAATQKSTAGTHRQAQPGLTFGKKLALGSIAALLVGGGLIVTWWLVSSTSSNQADGAAEDNEPSPAASISEKEEPAKQQEPTPVPSQPQPQPLADAPKEIVQPQKDAGALFVASLPNPADATTDAKGAKVHLNKGRQLEQATQHDAAIEEYRASLQLDPGFYKTWGELGYALKNGGKAVEAEAVGKKALELGTADDRYQSNVLLWMGMLMQETGRKTEAVDYLQKSVNKNPNNSYARTKLNEIQGGAV